MDIRSDLYSLGVTLWEMLIGQAPFQGSSVEAMYQHRQSPLPMEQLEVFRSRSSSYLRYSSRRTRCAVFRRRPNS